MLWALIFMDVVYIWGTSGSFKEIGNDTLRWIQVSLSTTAIFEIISLAVNGISSFIRDTSSKKTDDDVA